MILMVVKYLNGMFALRLNDKGKYAQAWWPKQFLFNLASVFFFGY